jgi:hypothetical protein
VLARTHKHTQEMWHRRSWTSKSPAWYNMEHNKLENRLTEASHSSSCQLSNCPQNLDNRQQLASLCDKILQVHFTVHRCMLHRGAISAWNMEPMKLKNLHLASHFCSDTRMWLDSCKRNQCHLTNQFVIVIQKKSQGISHKFCMTKTKH